MQILSSMYTYYALTCAWYTKLVSIICALWNLKSFTVCYSWLYIVWGCFQTFSFSLKYVFNCYNFAIAGVRFQPFKKDKYLIMQVIWEYTFLTLVRVHMLTSEFLLAGINPQIICTETAAQAFFAAVHKYFIIILKIALYPWAIKVSGAH